MEGPGRIRPRPMPRLTNNELVCRRGCSAALLRHLRQVDRSCAVEWNNCTHVKFQPLNVVIERAASGILGAMSEVLGVSGGV